MSGGTSSRHAFPYLATGQAQKELTHNEALALIDIGLNASAETIGVNEPPTAPAIGQCWIVGDDPVGVWTDHAQSLAGWTTGGWRYVPAFEGLRVWLRDRASWAVRESTGWVIGDVRGTRFVVAGQQVVGARLPGLAPVTGGATIDVEARTALASVIQRLVDHGLIAP